MLIKGVVEIGDILKGIWCYTVDQNKDYAKLGEIVIRVSIFLIKV